MLSVEVQFQIETLYSDGLKHLNALTHQSVVYGYWNCIVWAVCRLMPNVINPTLAEY